MSLFLRPFAWPSFTVFVGALLISAQAFADHSSFHPSIEGEAPRPKIAEAGTFSLRLSFNSTLAFSNPYTAVVGGQSQNFRYQSPEEFGIEADYALTNHFEIGAEVSYASFDSQLLTGSTSQPLVETVSWKALPMVTALVRYRFQAAPGFSPELEAGAGLGYGSIQVTSSDLSTTTISNSRTAFTGHLAAGIAFSWADSYSLHAAVGYGILAMGSDQYTQGAVLNVSQASSFSGVFVKSQLRYEF